MTYQQYSEKISKFRFFVKNRIRLVKIILCKKAILIHERSFLSCISIAERAAVILDFRILKNIPDLHKNEKKLYISNQVSQKNLWSGKNVKMDTDERAAEMQQFYRNK